MADESRPRRIEWRAATITQVIPETGHAKTLVLDVPGWPGHSAGQHVDVRLTAEDG
jgi:ferredoxin-NADP reductase